MSEPEWRTVSEPDEPELWEAEFWTRCMMCMEPIEPGDLIVNDFGVWVHEGCV